MNETQIRTAIFAVLKALGILNAMKTLVITNDLIEVKVRVYGSACRHNTWSYPRSAAWWYTHSNIDAQWTLLSESPRVEAHGNQDHIGCPTGPDWYLIQGATWVIEHQQDELPVIRINSSISVEEFENLAADLQDSYGHLSRV